MPNKHAAIKALRQTKKHTTKNMRMKTHVRALTHQVHSLIKAGKKDEAVQTGRKLQQIIAKAAKTHLLHKNTAANKTSSLQRALNAMK